MKLIVAVVQDYDADPLLRSVTALGHGATRIASSGGFLRTGNTTVLMGVTDDEVGPCLDAIGNACGLRSDGRARDLAGDLAEWYPPGLADVSIGGAVLFVLSVARFERMEAIVGTT